MKYLTKQNKNFCERFDETFGNSSKVQVKIQYFQLSKIIITTRKL